RAVTFEVEGDVDEACRLARVDDSLADPRLTDPRQLSQTQLDAGDLVVPAHAHLFEPEPAQGVLQSCDLLQPFVRDGAAVRDSTRQARRGRLCPDAQAQRSRQCSHVLLAQPQLEQWAAHAGVACRVEPWAIVT